jgi:hypothetical protein
MKKACKWLRLAFFVNAIIVQSHFYGTNFVHSPFQNRLPKPSRTTLTIFASNPEVSGEFYAMNDRGLFISTDSGLSWRTF